MAIGRMSEEWTTPGSAHRKKKDPTPHITETAHITATPHITETA